MLDSVTKTRINTARDILVGKVPDPKSQVEQITIALIYKFMDDMDVEAEELGGKRTFFAGKFSKYAWRKIFDPSLSGIDLLNMYSEAITTMDTNPGVPKLFRDIFKNAYLPYRDPETLKSFLKIINEFEYTHSEKLGDAFEFLLSILGSQGDAGQFRTPRHIIDFMVGIIDPKKHEIILDPACGTAGFLISSYKHIIKQNSSNYVPDEAPKVISEGTQSVNEVILTTNGYSGDKLTADERRVLADNIHGYDISPDMVRLSLVNMYLHGVKEPQIFEYDSLTSEDHWNEYSDVILANPPFMSPKGGIRPHKRFSVQSNRSEVLFVDYIAEHLTQDGRAAVIVPEGIIFQSGNSYKQLRKMLVNKYLVGVISLPAGVFQPYSGVKTSILWLDKSLAKKTDKILFVKIENDGFDLGAQRRAIKANDLPVALQKILEYKNHLLLGRNIVFEAGMSISLVERDGVSENGDYNLSKERYIKNIFETSEYKLTDLNSICQVKGGKRLPKGTDFADAKTNHSYIRVSDFKPNSLNTNNIRYITEEVFKEISNYTISSDNVYISIAGTIGIFGIIPEQLDGASLTENAAKFIFDKSQLNKFFLSYIGNSDRVKEQIKNLTHSVGVPKLALERIKTINIPLPSLAVQEEIVQEIQSYQKLIDGARQVVESYKPRIDIDPAWEMMELGEVCKIRGGYAFKSSDYTVRGIQLIRMGNVKRMSFDYQNSPSYLPAEFKQQFTNYIIRKGDLLISMTGTVGKEDYGNVCMIDVDDDFLLNQRVGKFEFTTENIVPKFIYYISITDEFRRSLFANSSGGVRQANISSKGIESVQVPIPPVDVQRKIIEKLDKEQTAVDSSSLLIDIFTQKIKDRIAKVWGDEKFNTIN
jgi:type I restriction enzyme M protein